VEILCEVLCKVCVPLAGERVQELREGLTHDDQLHATMVEVELCVSLIFKPLRHNMKTVINKDPSVFLALWVPILNVIKEILENDSIENDPLSRSPLNQNMTNDTRELTVEHLRNVIMVLSSFGVLKGATEEYTDGSISAQTWSLIEEMGYCKKVVDEWKSAAAKPPSDHSAEREEEE
jgi:hypothetical protein